MKRITFFVLIFSVQIVVAQVPQTLSYQGVLTDVKGKVVSDSIYSIVFKLYDVQEGGTPLWLESHNLSVHDGNFNVMLGSNEPLNLPFDKPYWLAMKIGQNKENTVRIELSASAYSLNARSIADSIVTGDKIKQGHLVRSVNTLTDDIVIAAGENVKIDQSGDSLIISAGFNSPVGDSKNNDDHAPKTGTDKNTNEEEGKIISDFEKVNTEANDYDLIVDNLQVRNTIYHSAPDPATIIHHNTNASGMPTGKGFRIRYQSDFFGIHEDGLIFEKTDHEQKKPKGGMAFVNLGKYGDTKTVLSISGTNHVGIGTKYPYADLHIRGVDDELLRIEDQLNDNGLVIGTDQSLLEFLRIVPHRGKGLAITSKEDQIGVFVRSSDAYVGVGISDPLANFHINSQGDDIVRIDDKLNNNGFTFGTSVTSTTYMRIKPHSGIGLAVTDINDRLGLFVSSSNANVGVGHASPSALLHINSLQPSVSSLNVNVIKQGVETDKETVEYNSAKINKEELQSSARLIAAPLYKTPFTVDLGSENKFRINGYGNVGIGGRSYTNVSLNLKINPDNDKAFKIEDQNQKNIFAVRNDGNTGINFLWNNVQLNVRNNGANEYAFNVEKFEGKDIFSVFKSGRVVVNSEVTGPQNESSSYGMDLRSKDQGLRIRLDHAFPDKSHDYVSFVGNNGTKRGRIEGMNAGNAALSWDFISYEIVSATRFIAAFSDVAGAVASANVCVGAGAVGCPPIASLIVSTGIDLGALVIEEVFYHASYWTRLGVSYESGSGDYAEWLERLNQDEKMQAGDVVGVFGGKISKSTKGAQQIMAVSTAPIVLGNMPQEDKKHLFEKVAFMGQVPVKVWGVVNEGDYIIPSGFEDGTAVPVTPEMMTIEEYGKVVGRAWSSSANTMLKMINVAIGLKSGDMAQFIKQQQTETERLRTAINKKDDELKNAIAEIAKMKVELSGLKEIHVKMTKLETILDQFQSFSNSEKVAAK